MRSVFLSFALFPLFAFAQTATFYADTAKLRMHAGNQRFAVVKNEMEWKINGQTFQFGSPPVEVHADPDIADTLFYKQNNKSGWITLVCNIRKPLHYKFVYNTCCDAFNVVVDDKSIPWGEVAFRIEDDDDKATYLGSLDDAQIVVTSSGTAKLTAGCRSMMASSVYTISLDRIEICSDTTGCDKAYCLREKSGEFKGSDFYYRVLRNEFSIPYFLILDRRPALFVFNAKTGKLTIK